MTFAQLRTFVAVADAGSVRAAADQLMVTPSAVSTALAALQERVGIALVVREGRGVRLTAAGQAYAGYARRILGLLETARVAATGEVDPAHGELRLGALTTAAEQVVPALLAGFSERFPTVGLHLEVGNRERVRALLDHHEVDLVVSGRPAPGPAQQVHGVRANALVVVAPAGRAPGPDVLAWLGAQTWLLREHGSGTRATTSAWLDHLELAPRTLTLGSNVAIVAAVAAGLGVTLVSRDAVAHGLREGALGIVDAPGTPLPRDWHLVAPAGPLPATAALLVTWLLETGAFRPLR